MSWWKWPARIGALAAAPFTGGASMMAMPMIEAGGRGGNMIQNPNDYLRTPGFNPNAADPFGSQTAGRLPSAPGSNTPSTATSPEAQSQLEKLWPWIQTGAGIGANIYGANLAGREMGKANEQVAQMRAELLRQAEEEKARRGQMTKMALPAMFRDMGFDPSQVTQRMGAGPINLGDAPPQQTQQQMPQQQQAPPMRPDGNAYAQMPQGWTPDPNNPIHMAALKNKYGLIR